MSSTPASPQLATLRRIIVAVIVVSFSVAAIMGIIALLARDLGDVGVKVLLTTATVGLYSIAVLCCATLAGKRLSGFGIAGAAVAVLAAAYTELGNETLAADARRVLQQNEPGHPFLSGDWPDYPWTVRKLNPFAGEKSAIDNDKRD